MVEGTDKLKKAFLHCPSSEGKLEYMREEVKKTAVIEHEFNN